MGEKMQEPYITKENIEEKTNKWLNELDFSNTRKQLFNFNIKKSALIVVDMQEYFTSDKSHAYIPETEVIIPKINSLIKKFNDADQPVILTHYTYKDGEKPGIMGRWWGDTITAGNPLSKISSLMKYTEKNIILRKNRYSAFHKTNLDEILKVRDIEQIVITGVMTHLCCETTARDAFMHDYEVYFVIDSNATDSEDFHLSSLKTLSDGFVMPVTTEEILKGG